MNRYIKLVWLKFASVVFFALTLTSASCSAQKHRSSQIVKEISNQVWIHSYEEDSGDVMVYREQGFDFPPSRGREGFQINADSTFILYGIAPTDGVQKKKGRWTLKDGKLQVAFDGHESAGGFFSIELLSFENGLLKTRKIQ